MNAIVTDDPKPFLFNSLILVGVGASTVLLRLVAKTPWQTAILFPTAGAIAAKAFATQWTAHQVWRTSQSATPQPPTTPTATHIVGSIGWLVACVGVAAATKHRLVTAAVLGSVLPSAIFHRNAATYLKRREDAATLAQDLSEPDELLVASQVHSDARSGSARSARPADPAPASGTELARARADFVQARNRLNQVYLANRYRMNAWKRRSIPQPFEDHYVTARELLDLTERDNVERSSDDYTVLIVRMNAYTVKIQLNRMQYGALADTLNSLPDNPTETDIAAIADTNTRSELLKSRFLVGSSDYSAPTDLGI